MKSLGKKVNSSVIKVKCLISNIDDESIVEILGNDSNLGVDSKERGDCMKDGNKGSNGGASRTKSKLIMKGKCGWGARSFILNILCIYVQ